MHLGSVKQLALDLAGEDWYGLYELIWRLNARYPGESEAKRLSLSIEAMTDLVKCRHLVVVRFDRVPTPLSHAEGLAILQEGCNGEPQNDSPSFGFGRA